MVGAVALHGPLTYHQYQTDQVLLQKFNYNIKACILNLAILLLLKNMGGGGGGVALEIVHRGRPFLAFVICQAY